MRPFHEKINQCFTIQSTFKIKTLTNKSKNKTLTFFDWLNIGYILNIDSTD